MADELDQMGPIDYIVVEFPGSRMNGEGIAGPRRPRGPRADPHPRLRLRAEGRGRLVAGVAIADLDGDGELDLAVFEGASSGLLDEDDIAEASGVLQPGSSAGILVYENVWAAPFATAIRRGGGQLVASGRIPVQAILAALDAAEARDA